MQKNTCIITARKGSKRLPGKNRMLFKGQPLYKHALKTALGSGLFDKIIFSTDDGDILKGIKNTSNVISDERPDILANDTASILDVGMYVIGKYSDFIGNSICFLTPCHPFRTAKHLIEAFHLYQEKKAVSLISVTRFPCSTDFSLTIKNGYVSRSWNGLVRDHGKDSQFYPNGLLSIVKTSYFIKNKNLYSPETVAYEIPWPEALDIDIKEDYLLAKKLEDVCR